MVQPSGGIDVALAPIGLLILLAIGVGFLLLLAALVKHGYGKALAIVFGGALSLFVVVAMFANYLDNEVAVQGELITTQQMVVDVIGKPKIELEKTVTVASSPITAEVKTIKANPQEEPDTDVAETPPSDTAEVDAKSADSEPEDSEQTLEEWTAQKSAEDSLILTAEPYLGSVIDGQGKPVKAVKVELMNQLSEWLADEVPGLNYYSNWLDNTPNTTLVNAPTGTTQDELWKRFVADYHITKQTTSVGDTETLSISVTNNGEPMVWISELTKKQNLQRAHDSRLRFYLLGGGGTFIGLVTLYGLLSVGSKESDPTNG